MTTSTGQESVSAVMPVHNGQDYLAEAIESVLAQSRPVLQCIVIDDGSTDATPEVVRAFGDAVTYVRQDRSGVSVARNRGVELARCELVAFLDHDDVWLPEKLARQTALLAREGATMALCAVTAVDSAGVPTRTLRMSPGSGLVDGMLTFDGTETVSCSSAGLMRRETLLAMGGFDPALGMSADWDLLMRVLLEGRLAYVEDPLVLYRVHGANMSRQVELMERDMTHAFAKAFAHPSLPENLRDRRQLAYSRLYRMLAGSYRDAGEWAPALRSLATALHYNPRLALELVRIPGRHKDN